MKKNIFLALAMVPVLSGCFTVPMTPDEFRQQARQSSLSNVETFEVRRSVAEVGRTFRKKAAECLSYELTSTKTPTIGFGSSTRVYAVAKPTVLVSANKAELHFQVKSMGNIAKEPPGGNYFLIADADAVGKDRTRIQIVRGGVVNIATAIRAWANGDERGCPDPMRTFER